MDKFIEVVSYIIIGVCLVVFWPLAIALGFVFVWVLVAAAVYKDPALKDHED